MNNIDPTRIRVSITRTPSGSYFILKQIWSTKWNRFIHDVRHNIKAAFPVNRDMLLDSLDDVLDCAEEKIDG